MSGRQIYARTIASGGALLFTHGSNRLFPLIENESILLSPALDHPLNRQQIDKKQKQKQQSNRDMVTSSSRLVIVERMRNALHILPVNASSEAMNRSIQQVAS